MDPIGCFLFDVIWFQLLYKCWRLVLVFGVVWAVVINLMALMAAVRIAGFSIAWWHDAPSHLVLNSQLTNGRGKPYPSMGKERRSDPVCDSVIIIDQKRRGGFASQLFP